MQHAVQKITVLLLLAIVFTGCSPLKRVVSITNQYTPTQQVTIIQTGQQLPDGLTRIGSVSVGDGGLTLAEDCTYEACIKAVEEEAKKVGANIIYIVHVKTPNNFLGVGYSLLLGDPSLYDINSSCYGIVADLYRKVE